MATNAFHRTDRHAGEHLSAGLTLIEIVVSIAIVGCVGLGVALFVTQIADTYVTARTQTLEYLQFRAALEQIARELSRCLPESIEIRPASLAFDVVLTSGAATVLNNGQLSDSNNPEISLIRPGMSMLFRARDRSAMRLEIGSVAADSGTIYADGIASDFPCEYWVIQSGIQYALSGQAVYQRNEPDGISAMLCDHVNAFEARLISDNLLYLSLRGTGESSAGGVTVRRWVSL
ncbi:MAG TPA: type II secretion system protein [bacterium]|nr:type II secretion system protein [bacterium]HQO37046.1 type II secretion system protein [bacterium]HQQ00397.1 type II secretion system protein [bacterium]